jgi:hypothetical protein
MAFIDKLKEELDRAGKAAQGAFDEGKMRLEAFRTRQLADKAAQALGYAVFRAKQSGTEVDADTYTRLSATLATHDAEASRYEADLESRRRESSARKGSEASTGAADTAAAAADTAGAAADAAASAGAAAADATASPAKKSTRSRSADTGESSSPAS